MFRNITCPGKRCEEVLPLSFFDEHAKTCGGITIEKAYKVFGMGKDAEYAKWRTAIFKRRNETFALNVELVDHKFRIECVMFAEREKCDRFLPTISIPDPKCETFFNWQINPAPIGTTKESVIVVHKKSLAKILKTKSDGGYSFEINFKVSEKRRNEANIQYSMATNKDVPKD